MTREAQIRQTADEWLGYYHPTCTQDMLVEAFRCGAEWADRNPKSPWISVEERLPEVNQVVLTLGSEKNNEDVRILFRGDVSGNFVCIDYDEITHWMPIPELQTTK